MEPEKRLLERLRVPCKMQQDKNIYINSSRRLQGKQLSLEGANNPASPNVAIGIPKASVQALSLTHDPNPTQQSVEKDHCDLPR